MSEIVDATLRRIFDSRGQETVEATVKTRLGEVGRVGAPSGASTGRHEVRALPPGGAMTAVEGFRGTILPKLVGLDVQDQATVDAALHAADGTRNFGRIGGNTATALSLACAIASAAERKLPLWRVLARPGVPGTAWPGIVGNCMNGGRHAIGGPDIQEFHAFAPGPRVDDAIRAALAVHAEIGRKLREKYPKLSLGRGDEGGWVAPLGDVEAIELLAEACTTIQDRLHVPVFPGLDLAASEFYEEGRYRYRGQTLDPEGQLGFVTHLVDRFGLRYLEDPFEEESFESFARLTAAVGSKTLVVGDDLYTTDLDRLKDGVRRKSSNAVLIKVNQVGTLTDTFATVDFARSQGLATIASHRSGDLPEAWLAHFALGTAAAGIKCGLIGGERVAKLNELLRLAAPSEPAG